METIDIIRQLCSEHNMSVAQLENILGYGNGSLGKSRSMSADRMYKIAQYFGVSVEYLITGEDHSKFDHSFDVFVKQEEILIEMNKINQAISNNYKAIADYQRTLSDLEKEYKKLSEQKRQLLKKSPDYDQMTFTDLDCGFPFIPQNQKGEDE